MLKSSILALCGAAFSAAMCFAAPKNDKISCYETNSERTKVFQKSELNFNNPKKESDVKIQLNPSAQLQEMEGFGAAVTGAVAYNLTQIKPELRKELLNEVFSEDGMGYSMIRISIGCSDFSLDEYTWCDKPGIENFAMHEYDRRDLIPMLKEILKVNPNIKIMAAPWTCPKWMKVDNIKTMKPYDSWTGGNLNPKYYDDYATYFVKWVQAMEENGIPIHYVSIQNESLNFKLSASLQMPWEQQKEFIKHLGRAFEKANIKAKILVYDHNYQYSNYPQFEYEPQEGFPLHIYADPEASKYAHGAAYHPYPSASTATKYADEMTYIHSKYPDKKLYFTEMTIRAWDNTWSTLPGGVYNFAEEILWSADEICLDTVNNWAACVLTWNLLLDDKYGPWRMKGCHRGLGNIDVFAFDYKNPYTVFRRNGFFYTVGHMSKVVKQGAYRIESSSNSKSDAFNFSAFKNPDGSMALVAVNKSNKPITVEINDGNKVFTHEISRQTVVSFKWNEKK